MRDGFSLHGIELKSTFKEQMRLIFILSYATCEELAKVIGMPSPTLANYIYKKSAPCNRNRRLLLSWVESISSRSFYIHFVMLINNEKIIKKSKKRKPKKSLNRFYLTKRKF